MSAHILNIFIEKINRTIKVRFHHTTAELSKFYVRYLFYRAHTTAHMNVRMRQFQGI
jgi:hypothetical protein